MKTNSAEVREGDDGGIKRGIFQKISMYTKKARKKYYTHEICNYDT